MMRYIRSLKFSIPLAIIIFATVTIRIKVSFVDGPNFNYYGFPLPYLRWCGFSSLEYNLDLLKFITDLLFYISLCTAIVSYKPLFNLLNNYKKIAIISLLFLSAVPLFFILTELFLLGQYYTLVSIEKDGGTILNWFLHFGPARPY
jgi:hypothetical protein